MEVLKSYTALDLLYLYAKVLTQSGSEIVGLDQLHINLLSLTQVWLIYPKILSLCFYDEKSISKIENKKDNIEILNNAINFEY